MALATALGEWVRIHTWSLNTLVDSAVYLEGGTDALLSSDSRPPAFLMPVAPRHATARTGNPSEAFEVLGRAIMRKGDYPVFQELWGKVEAQYDSVAQTLRAQGFFDKPSVGGLLPAIYLIPNISICVLQTHAILRFPIQHVEDDPQDEHTRAAFRDMQEVVMEGISDEAMVFRCTSDSARSEPDLGTFVYHKKAWKWQYLDPNAWDRFDKHVRPRTKPVTDLPARSLLSLFDTRNVRDAALRVCYSLTGILSIC